MSSAHVANAQPVRKIRGSVTAIGRIPTISAVLVAVTVCACSSVGPPTVERDRSDYATAIGDSWKHQTLLNIVKVRYGDFPVFLEIAQVIAGYQMESTFGAGFAAGNASGPTVGPFVVGGSLLAQGRFTDRPTVIYAPLTGNDFLKRLMTPIPPSALLFVLQSGYAADYVMSLAVNSVNGVNNESRRSAARSADPQFVRLGQLLRELQLSEAIQIRIERRKGDAESTIISFPPRDDPQLTARSEEIRRILRLKPGLRTVNVFYGGYSGMDNEIAMSTRSMLQIMLEVGAVVRVPASDVAAGMAAPGFVDVDAGKTAAPSLLNIVSGDAAPKDAYVAIPYNGRWFWIANTDVRSKFVFSFVMLLFSISDTGQRGATPVVTVPAN
jgi:hypothetical protein